MDITIELKQQSELLGFCNVTLFHQYAIAVERFFQDIREEPFRDESHLQVSAITIVRGGAEVNDTVRIKRVAVPFRIKRKRYCARDMLWGGITVSLIGFGEDSYMYVFEVVLYLVGFIVRHYDASISK